MTAGGEHSFRPGPAARILGLASRTRIEGPPSQSHSGESMLEPTNRDSLAAAALWTGVLIPFLYFGKQFAAAFFFPRLQLPELGRQHAGVGRFPVPGDLQYRL